MKVLSKECHKFYMEKLNYFFDKAGGISVLTSDNLELCTVKLDQDLCILHINLPKEYLQQLWFRVPCSTSKERYSRLLNDKFYYNDVPSTINNSALMKRIISIEFECVDFIAILLKIFKPGSDFHTQFEDVFEGY
jgi:hypothetical protein